MRVVIAGDYPLDPPHIVGGIQAVIYNTLQKLGDYGDLDLHVVTCEKWAGRPAAQTVKGRWTTHYLPSSPRIPHSLSMLTLDRSAVRRAIESLRPGLIHAHGQAAAYPFAAFDTGRPTLVTVHGINMLEAQLDPRGGRLKGWLRATMWRQAEERCLRRASDIVVISPFVQQIIAPYTRARLHVVENPVHPDLFALEPQPQPGKVLMVGSVQKRKGTLEAIQAMAIVHQQAPLARLYIAGGIIPAYQDYGHMVRRYVDDTGAGDYVKFLGQMQHQDLLAAYRSSQVFVLPSYLEASSVAVVEAMAAGLPSVVSDIGGTAHLVTEGVTGYRVPAGDVQALAERILLLLRNEAMCQRVGTQAREFARSHASAEIAAHKTHDLYLALAGSQP
jgi:glycogen(starch) synthase